jgi:hypothetical protein
MAMKFREPNMTKWRGVRPGHNGTQVAKHNHAINALVIVHTVTDGKTFFLTTLTLSVGAPAAGVGWMYVRDAADVDAYFLVFVQCSATTASGPFSVTFNPPLEIPEKYDIVVRSNVAVLDVYGFVHGWEE